VTARLIGLCVALAVAAASWMLTCSAWQYDQIFAGIAPLEPRRFDRLTLITIGTGGASENPRRRGPCTAVGWGSRIVLVDAGRGVAEALRAAEIPASQPDTVFLTSLLPESTVGLDDLLFAGWLGERRQPLRLIGPVGTRKLAEALVAGHGRGIAGSVEARDLPPADARFEAVEVNGGWSERLDDLVVSTASLPDGPIEALAYRFEWRGRSAVIDGAGWGRETLERFARGANLLVHEAVFVLTSAVAAQLELPVEPERLRREAAFHTGIDEVGGLARRAGVETLVLVRLRPPPVYDIQLTSVIDDEFPGRIVIADDGDEITP
jgi:ribonuclease Z